MTTQAVKVLVSGTDGRQYRHLELANKLQVLLISDPASDKAAACCDVAVGSMADPADAQGLAHFLEHMLFMGTEKYPEENEYSAFLNEHGGYSNAYTAQENTVYYFDVNSAHLEKSLDLFASFFTCPLFTESSTSREINAVDSENSKNLQSDSWRKFQLFKSMARKDHPLNAFSTGNLETLGKVPESKGMNIRDMMIAFYNTHYSANLMKVAIYGVESLDQLETWAREKFSNVPNKNTAKPVYPSDPFGSAQLKKMVDIVPVRDLKSVDLFFPIPAVELHYKSLPMKYLAHLIGHESGGSILSALKAKLLANSLSCYQYESNNDFACFAVSIDLTDVGICQVDEVVAAVFAYIGMLKRSGPEDWIWQELKDMSDMKFNFLDKIDPADYVTRLANHLQIYEPQHVIAGGEVIFEKNLALTSEYLEHLKPESCIVFTNFKGFAGKTELKEQWYGTEHNVRDISTEQLASWNESYWGNGPWAQLMALPKPNEFVPTDFSLRERQTDEQQHFPVLRKKVVCGESQSVASAETATVDDVKVSLDTVTVTDVPVAEETPVGDELDEADGSDEGNDGEDEDAEAEAEDVASSNEVWDPVLAGKFIQVFHKQDDQWNVPKTNVYLSLESCFATCTPWNTVMTDLFQVILKEIMNEYSYYADCAGLYYGVQLAKGGLEIYFQGYSHKLHTLVERTAEEIFKLAHDRSACSPELFKRMKDKQLRSLKNLLFSQPYYHCILGGLLCLEEPRWSNAEKYQALQSATLDDFVIFANQFLAMAKLEVLVNGNITTSEAIYLSQKTSDILKAKALPYSQEVLRRSVALRPAVEYIYRQSALQCNPNEVNSAVENLYFIGEGAGKIDTNAAADNDDSVNGLSASDFAVRMNQEAHLELVLQLIKEAAFDQLRTKEQLGYIVFSSAKRVAQNVLALSVIVQSSHKDPVYLDSRIEDFLVSYRQTLQDLSDEKYESFVNAVVEKLLEKPKNLDQETDKFWVEVRQNTYLFDRAVLLVKELRSETINKNSVLAFYDAFVLNNSSRRKFSSQFFGKDCPLPKAIVAEKAKKTVLIKDPSLFKRTMSMLAVQSYEVKEYV